MLTQKNIPYISVIYHIAYFRALWNNYDSQKIAGNKDLRLL